MKVDFLATWEEFLTATRHCQFFKFQERGSVIIVRAGGSGYRYPSEGEKANDIRKWCESHAFRIIESIPEELVFA